MTGGGLPSAEQFRVTLEPAFSVWLFEMCVRTGGSAEKSKIVKYYLQSRLVCIRRRAVPFKVVESRTSKGQRLRVAKGNSHLLLVLRFNLGGK